MHRIALILSQALPGDIRLQITLLEKYLASTFDIVSHLSAPLSYQILKHLPVRELVRVRGVSRAWCDAVRNPLLWRYHCLRVTARDKGSSDRERLLIAGGCAPATRSVHRVA